MLRWATPRDAEGLRQVFYASVREGPSPYTQAQRAAWVPQLPEAEAWAKRLGGLNTAVCDVNGQSVGFMTVEPGGYIDLAFILAEYRGTGVFRALFGMIEQWAVDHREPLLWTHASLLAEPAFQALGFLVIHQETVARSGQMLDRAKMEKVIA